MRFKLLFWGLCILASAALHPGFAFAQSYSSRCETCDVDMGQISVRIPICLDADQNAIGNTICMITFNWNDPKPFCSFRGDPCRPSQPVGTYQSYRIQEVMGFLASSAALNPDNIDWCTIWGMPAGCT
jgi:hypothetical protein